MQMVLTKEKSGAPLEFPPISTWKMEFLFLIQNLKGPKIRPILCLFYFFSHFFL